MCTVRHTHTHTFYSTALRCAQPRWFSLTMTLSCSEGRWATNTLFHPRQRQEVDEHWVMIVFSVSSLYARNQLIVYADESSVSGVTEGRLHRPRLPFKLRAASPSRWKKEEKTHETILSRRAAQLVHYSACGGYYWQSLFELPCSTTGPKALKRTILFYMYSYTFGVMSGWYILLLAHLSPEFYFSSCLFVKKVCFGCNYYNFFSPKIFSKICWEHLGVEIQHNFVRSS